ncbi:hypothetical protein VTI74DRAFT_8409 [Chaetomium olivicolor]
MATQPPPAGPQPNADTNVTFPFAPLRAIAKRKARSHETSKAVHLPLLQSHLSAGPEVVLVGDSMFERMTTTGQSPNFVSAWPSAAMLSDAMLASLNVERLERVFNAGVGGDQIQNVAFRLVGERCPEDEEKDLPGILPVLAECGSVKLWVVHVGTNHLSHKKGLRDRDRDALAVLLRALLGVNPRAGPGCRVLVTGLFYRKDVPRALVDETNAKLERVVKGLNEVLGEERVVFLHAVEEVKTEEHLVDHVHLNLEGYQLWVRRLFLKVVEMLHEREGTTS